MEGRMSRLRRSLSRSLIQLHSIHRSSDNLADLPGPPMNFERKFATPTTFPELQQLLVQNNNELLREIIAVFEERSNLDLNYAKSMYRLSARLHKVAQGAQGTIDQVWATVADQYDSHATIHSNLGASIRDDIVQPLKSIFLAQQKSIKKSWNVANRELREYRDQKAEVLKTKNRLDSASRDLERIEQTLDNDKGTNIKLAVKKRKALDAVYKLEEEYLDDICDSEKKRRTVVMNLKKAARNLEHVEKQRLDHTQTALGRFNRTISQLAPSLNQMFERHISVMSKAAQCNPTTYIMSVEPSTSSNHVLYLGDFYSLPEFSILLPTDRATYHRSCWSLVPGIPFLIL
uniref:SH3 domain-containing protein n=1 Tax=Steinernema glaseri TaxID=37863 RepID=A0A1I7Y377_9BILA